MAAGTKETKWRKNMILLKFKDTTTNKKCDKSLIRFIIDVISSYSVKIIIISKMAACLVS